MRPAAEGHRRCRLYRKRDVKDKEKSGASPGDIQKPGGRAGGNLEREERQVTEQNEVALRRL